MISLKQLSGIPITPGGRLTLSSTSPFVTTDTSSTNNLYYLPDIHAFIPLFDGNIWRIYEMPSVGISINFPVGLAANTNYAVFMQWNSGNPILSLSQWQDNNTRSSTNGNLIRLNGYVVRASDNALHLGDIRTDSSGVIQDTIGKRFVSNRYNRKLKQLVRFEPTASWNPTAANIMEPWGNRTGATTAGLVNRVEVLNCEMSDLTNVTFNSRVRCTTNSTVSYIYLGVNSTNSAISPGSVMQNATLIVLSTTINTHLPLGYSYIQALQFATVVNNVYGGNGECGLSGSFTC